MTKNFCMLRLQAFKTIIDSSRLAGVDTTSPLLVKTCGDSSCVQLFLAPSPARRQVVEPSSFGLGHVVTSGRWRAIDVVGKQSRV